MWAVSMELSSGSCRIEPVWENKELKALNIFIDARATLLEMQDSQSLSGQELSDYLVSQLENYISDKVSYVLQLSRKLQCDFLGLSGLINMKSANKFSSLSESFRDILPGLPMQISVSAELCHTKDIKDSDA